MSLGMWEGLVVVFDVGINANADSDDVVRMLITPVHHNHQTFRQYYSL